MGTIMERTDQSIEKNDTDRAQYILSTIATIRRLLKQAANYSDMLKKNWLAQQHKDDDFYTYWLDIILDIEDKLQPARAYLEDLDSEYKMKHKQESKQLKAQKNWNSGEPEKKIDQVEHELQNLFEDNGNNPTM